MNWYSSFKTTFFSIWTDIGLPSPYEYEEIYSNKLKSYHFTHKKCDINSLNISPLNPQVLNRVYGFGNLIGEVIGGLSGLPDYNTKQRADWCGRFNLCISLFDYICDEQDGLKIISSIPAFQLFLDEFHANSSRLGIIERILNDLTITILVELKQEKNTKISNWKNGLIRVMKKMYNAECMLSTQYLNEMSHLELIKKALYLKSVEPFRIMAEWMSHGNFEYRSTFYDNNARELGRALGSCYWLIDDAKDVWLDFESNRWNLFLINAAKEQPELFVQSRDDLLDFKLTRIWENNNLVYRLSKSTVRRLVKVTSRLRSTPRKKELLGLVAASLARW